MKTPDFVSFLSLLAFTAQAVDIGIAAQEAYGETQQAERQSPFVDVRDPVEIMFVGFTSMLSMSTPYLLRIARFGDDARGSISSR